MTKIKNPTPCIICEKELDFSIGDDNEENYNQPAYGVACTTLGNYGSTVYDSIDGTRLEFSICDECLITKLKLMRLVRSHVEHSTIVISSVGDMNDSTKFYI